MELFGYRYDIPSFPITPPYAYPYDYKFCTLPKSEEKIHIVQDIYPQFPTPPLSGSPSPPAIWQKDYTHSPAERTSVIMKVTDHKVIEVKPTSPRQDEEYRCQWIDCWRVFNTLDALASHVTQVHAVASVGGLYYCKWEGCPRIHRGFNARYKMLVHVRTHTKEKPHQCQLCDKSFSRAENLKIHIRSHSGEKPYVCPFEGCNKAYSNSSDRFKHTRTHSTEKPYVCKVPGCQKRYTDPSSLRKHVKTYKHTSNLEESPQRGEEVCSEKATSTEYHHLAMCPEEKTVTPCEDGLFPQINCHCNHDCFDPYRKPDIYKFGKYFNEMFVTYEQSSDSISPSYWIEPHAQPKPTSIHHAIHPMDIDMPLDLTVNRGSR